MKIMDIKEFVNDICFKLQSSIVLSIHIQTLQIPLSIFYWQNLAKVTNIKNYGIHFIL